MTSTKRALPLAAGALIALAAGPLADAGAREAAPATAQAAKTQQAKHAAKGKQQRRQATRHVVLSGRGTPSPRLGRIGDVYLRTSDDTLWGPKTRRGWGRPRPLARRGPAGRRGATGRDGASGRTGATGPAGPSSAITPGTPSVVATVPAPGTIAAHYDPATRTVVDDATVTLDVPIPAGVSFVQLNMIASVPGMIAFAGCSVTGGGLNLTSSGDTSWDGGVPIPIRSATVAFAPQAFTARLECHASLGSGSGEGSATGTNVVVQPTNLALPPVG